MNTSTTTANGLGKAINHVLALDEETRAALTRYAGSVIAIELQNTRQTFHVYITSAGIALGDPPAVNADVTVRGTPGQLLAYLMAMKRDEYAGSGSIEINGNIALAQKLAGILRDLDPDWEEMLSERTGDSFARHAGNTIRNARQLLDHVRHTLRDNVSEYLRYESGMVVDRSEVDDFVRAVDMLRNDAERLTLRLDHLQRAAGD